ncbi:hypothetical protein SH501x_003931 [Pirellulaceae bacterium SH501]
MNLPTPLDCSSDTDSNARLRIPIPKLLDDFDHHIGRVHELLCHARTELSTAFDTWNKSMVAGEDGRSVEILNHMLSIAKQIEVDALTYELTTLSQLISQEAASERIALAGDRMITELQGVLSELRRWENRETLESQSLS